MQKITPTEESKINVWLNQRFPGGLRCSVCSGTDWFFQDSFLAVPNFVQPGALKTVALTCRACSFVAQFDAKRMGL